MMLGSVAVIHAASSRVDVDVATVVFGAVTAVDAVSMNWHSSNYYVVVSFQAQHVFRWNLPNRFQLKCDLLYIVYVPVAADRCLRDNGRHPHVG